MPLQASTHSHRHHAHALLSAAALGDVERFEELCAGRQANWRTPFGAELLMRAARGGHWEMVQAMLRRGAEIDAQDDLGWTALRHAAQAGYPAIVNGLYALGADVEVRARDGSTTLMQVIAHGQPHMLAALWAVGADANAAYAHGFTVLMTAVLRELPELVLEVLKAGADIDALNIQGYSALTLAVERGLLPMVDLLLNWGASVDIHGERGVTPLILAVTTGNIDIVERLIAGGAALDAVDEEGCTAMMHAAYCGQWETLEMLVRAGADVHAISHAGSKFGDYVLGYLRDAEVAPDAAGLTLAMHLAQQGLNTVLQALLSVHSEIHAVDRNGDSVLAHAVRAHNLPAIDLLRHHGADFHAVNHQGMTPFALLLQHVPQAMEDTPFQGSRGETALIRAAQLGFWTAAEMLILMGADIDAVDGAGNSALMHAAMRGHGPVLRMLLEMGADYTQRNHQGADARMLAAAAGHVPEEAALADAEAQTLREQTSLAAEQDLPAGLPLYCAVQPQAHDGAVDAAVTVDGLGAELGWSDGSHAGSWLAMIA